MARNEEKAQSLLNRYLTSKQDEKKRFIKKRPNLASECSDLFQADKFRQQIIREIGRKVLEIQNAGLGEHRLRDLNDEINKLIREKGHWETRIVELGGPDYAKTAPKIRDSQGNVVQEASEKGIGYRYFGAAKNLPGVKELFEKEEVKPVKRTRHDMFKLIDADYYGFRDEDDGILVKVEAEAEQKMRGKKIKEWQEQEDERLEILKTVKTGERVQIQDEEQIEAPKFVAYVPLPEKQEIERRVLEQRKKELLLKYTSEQLQEEQEEAQKMLYNKGG
eukprot:TRINITY_DN4261_c0_g2_i1.p2 TRINITY_DN4261_c0_g2~~TRINITY_DN4261_c0_g2_i1.p2  ORF type:complete len:277 (-),score=56.66 TRINITY_DN4261_c0_g2_i1:137-967(-)